MASDPNMLYATVAQIAATFVSILGGFLLTLGLSRVAERNRLERNIQRQRKVHEDIAKEDEEYIEKEKRAEEEHNDALLSIRLRALRNKIDDKQESYERSNAIQKLVSLNKERKEQIEDQIRRLHVAIQDEEELKALISVNIYQIKVLGGGFFLLTLLGIVGVGIPLYIMPVEVGEEGNLFGWIAQRGTIVLLGGLIIYVFIVFVWAENNPFFGARSGTRWFGWPAWLENGQWRREHRYRSGHADRPAGGHTP